MKGLTLGFVFVGVVSLGLADSFDLGNLTQYNPRPIQFPQLQGTTIWLSGTEQDAGLDVALSDDAMTKIQDAFKDCGQDENKCQTSVHEVLKSAEMQFDSRVEARATPIWVTKLKRISIFWIIAQYLDTRWHMLHWDEQPHHLFLPASVATKASAFTQTTPVTISAEGSQIAVITPAPDTTSLKGTVTPLIVPVTVANSNFVVGDMVMYMDTSFAARMDEIMHRTTECQDGFIFDRTHPSPRKRAGATMGQALCGAQAAAATIAEGGPLNDMLLMLPPTMTMNFREATGAIAQAADVLTQFVLAQAPVVNLPAGIIEQLPVILMTLAVETIINGHSLVAINRMAASLITTSALPTMTAAACPDPKAIELFCGFEEQDCEMKFVEKTEETVCASGKYKDCKCLAPGTYYENPLEADQVQAILDTARLFSKFTVGPTPECKKDQLSDVPKNVFQSTITTVYQKFCEKWVAGHELKMTVDARGKDRTEKRQLRIDSRTPPPDTSSWNHYNFLLGFTPTSTDKKCSVNCTQAYSRIADACSNTGAKNVPMATTGKVDVGCGSFDYAIQGPTVGHIYIRRDCHKDDFGGHNRVSKDWQYLVARSVCARQNVTIKKDNKSTNISQNSTREGVNYQYSIYWQEGCQYDFPGSDEVNPINPLQVTGHEGGEDCYQTLIDNYLKCDNAGTGGATQLGCLVYDFRASAL